MGKTYFNFAFLWNYISNVKNRPIDGTAFTFLVFMSIVTYFHGTYVLLPKVVVGLGFPPWMTYVGYVVTTWIVTAILSNLFLIRYRNSSILNRMLLYPKCAIQEPTPTLQSFANDPDSVIREQTKALGQHFMPKPFGVGENWHICAACEVFVPPGSWHCFHCKTCILRRDHHCIFAMACIGEENHSNFLGLLLYLGIGSSLASMVHIMYTLMFSETPFWWFVVKAFIPFYVLVFDFSVMNMVGGVNLLGTGCAWVVFIIYIRMALQNRTFVNNRNAKTSKYAYSHAEKFLGNNPMQRILWPFHSALKNNYNSLDVQEARKEQ